MVSEKEDKEVEKARIQATLDKIRGERSESYRVLVTNNDKWSSFRLTEEYLKDINHLERILGKELLMHIQKLRVDEK